MVSYIGYVRKDPDSDYGVEFPDVPGCITAGRTLDEARAVTAEARAGHLALLGSRGSLFPRLPRWKP
jgi:predicted RNase H-like HicB family nuclease